MSENVSGYILNFVIPQGPTGPQGEQGITGPTGPSFTNAYGGKYNDTSSSYTVQEKGILTVPLPHSMPSLNMSYGSGNNITVQEAGVYELNYYCNLSTSIATTITLAIRNNETSLFKNILVSTLNNDFTFNGSIILSLNSNSVLDMYLSTSSSIVTISLKDGLNASLSLKKIG